MKLYNDNQLVSVDWLLTLKLALLNYRSIASFSKRLFLINIAHSQNFDLLCLTKTWLDSSMEDNLLVSSDYIAGSRKNGSHGDAAFIRRNRISLNAISVKTDFCCSAVLNLGFPLLIVNLYNPPKNRLYRVNPLDIKLLLEYVLRRFEGTKTLIMGDFNQPDFEAESYHTGDVSFCSLIDFLLEQNFHQIVDRPTHNSNHMLDLIWSNFSEVLPGDYNLIEVPFSDHSCVTINIPCTIPKQIRSPIATIPRHLIRTAGAYFSESIFSVLLPKDDSFLDNWLLSFNSGLDMFRRIKRKKRIDAPYFYSSHAMHQLNIRNTAYRSFFMSQSNYPYSLDKDCEESIKLDTELFLEQFCQSNSGLHGCFRLLNALKSHSLPQSFSLPGEDKLLIDCPITIANAFNEFFVKSFEKPAHVYADFSEDLFNSVPITFSAVYSALLKTKDGCGLDRILLMCFWHLFPCIEIFRSYNRNFMLPIKLEKVLHQTSIQEWST